MPYFSYTKASFYSSGKFLSLSFIVRRINDGNDVLVVINIRKKCIKYHRIAFE